jgi:7-carboxy-7-deazaguanine synthase
MVDVKEKVSTLSLPLMEDFYTIQGEGAYQGSAAYFIRLGGCEVRCVWCDVKDSWDVNAHEKVKVSDMALRAKASGAKIVVVTGGEPTIILLNLPGS